MELRLELRLTFSGMLRLGSDFPPQSTVGAVGVKEGELGSDRPRRSGCRDEPEAKRATKAGCSENRPLPKQPQKGRFHNCSPKGPRINHSSELIISP